jgi:ABC-type antimicrobial peptide transport system permease subunit
VINRSLADALWPQGGAVGSCLYIRAPEVLCRTVVGIVADTRWDVAEAPKLQAYLPIGAAWSHTDRSLIPNVLVVGMRAPATGADLGRLRRVVVPLLAGGDQDLWVGRVADTLAPQLKTWRLAAVLFLVLGLLGLAAATAGIYGLVAYDVAQRSREIGVRISLGAPASTIVRLVVGSGLRVVGLGVVIGALAALAAGWVMAAVLFETSPHDGKVLMATGVTLAAAALLASGYPAARGCQVDPVSALRAE